MSDNYDLDHLCITFRHQMKYLIVGHVRVRNARYQI